MLGQLPIMSGGFSLSSLGILFSLVALETVLSADNAVALAALVEPLEDLTQQNRALNWGLSGAFVLRIILLLTASWVIQFWQVELVGALYLLWLGLRHFWFRFSEESIESGQQQLLSRSTSIWSTVVLIGLTDLAFSIDSVTTAVALSSETWLVITGCVIGMIALRFLAGLFVRWLERFTYLQDAAYLTVLGVGLRLLCKALQPNTVPPEWMVFLMIAVLFSWGFSHRTAPETEKIVIR